MAYFSAVGYGGQAATHTDAHRFAASVCRLREPLLAVPANRGACSSLIKYVLHPGRKVFLHFPNEMGSNAEANFIRI